MKITSLNEQNGSKIEKNNVAEAKNSALQLSIALQMIKAQESQIKLQNTLIEDLKKQLEANLKPKSADTVFLNEVNAAELANPDEPTINSENLTDGTDPTKQRDTPEIESFEQFRLRKYGNTVSKPEPKTRQSWAEYAKENKIPQPDENKTNTVNDNHSHHLDQELRSVELPKKLIETLVKEINKALQPENLIHANIRKIMKVSRPNIDFIYLSALKTYVLNCSDPGFENSQDFENQYPSFKECYFLIKQELNSGLQFDGKTQRSLNYINNLIFKPHLILTNEKIAAYKNSLSKTEVTLKPVDNRPEVTLKPKQNLEPKIQEPEFYNPGNEHFQDINVVLNQVKKTAKKHLKLIEKGNFTVQGINDTNFAEALIIYCNNFRDIDKYKSSKEFGELNQATKYYLNLIHPEMRRRIKGNQIFCSPNYHDDLMRKTTQIFIGSEDKRVKYINKLLSNKLAESKSQQNPVSKAKSFGSVLLSNLISFGNKK